MNEERTPIPCAVCGKMFLPRHKLHKCCCRRCSAALNRRKARGPGHEVVCRYCGTVFLTSSNAVFCSGECRSAMTRAPVKDRDREHTTDTAYLCQKWRREGLSVRQIADILGRTAESVRKALAVPLAPEEYRKMEEYRR